jgi:MFS family permease
VPRGLLLFVSVVVFADTAFYAAITPLLPALSDEFDLGKGEAGILAAAYPAGVLLGALPGGLLAARVGVRPTVIAGLTLIAVASLSFGLADDVAVLDASRLLQGLGSAASWAGAFGWLVGAAPREQRGALIGSALGAAIVGALMGPVIGAAADAAGRGPVFGAVGVIAAALIVWSLRLPAVAAEGGTLRDLAGATRDGRFRAGMWLVTLPGLMFGTLVVLLPLRFDELGETSAAIGAIFLVAAGLEAIVSPVIGRLSDRHGRLGPASFGVGASAVLMTLVPWPDSTALLVALTLLMWPALGVLWAPAMAMLADAAEHRGVAQGLAFSMINLAWAIGQTSGSAGGSRLAELGGDALPCLLLAGVAAATFAVLRFRRPAPTGK